MIVKQWFWPQTMVYFPFVVLLPGVLKHQPINSQRLKRCDSRKCFFFLLISMKNPLVVPVKIGAHVEMNTCGGTCIIMIIKCIALLMMTMQLWVNLKIRKRKIKIDARHRHTEREKWTKHKVGKPVKYKCLYVSADVYNSMNICGNYV